MISFTIFKSKFDSKTDKRMDLKNFDQFEELLRNMSRKRITSKEDAQLISPAIFVNDDTAHELPNSKKEPKKDGSGRPWYHRKNVNVLEWGGWAALDVDDWTPEGDLEDAIRRKFGHNRFVAYSTASSTRDLPKFRVVYALDDRVPTDKIAPLWWSLNESSGSLGDRQVKDKCRMYYIPATYGKYGDNDTYSFFFSGGDDPINVDQLIERYPMPKKSTSFFDKLPEDMQEAILKKKKDELENTNYKWTSYRDCPFWPKQLETEYRAISSTGWYLKLYAIMVAIAGKAIDKGYPITPKEIGDMIRQFDMETGGWYQDRPIEGEAKNAIDYVFRASV